MLGNSAQHSDYKQIITRAAAAAAAPTILFSLEFLVMLRCFILLLLSGISSCSVMIHIPWGSDFTLYCLPDAPPDLFSPEFSWRFAAENAKHFSQLNSTKSALFLKQINSSGFGTYECIVKGDTGEGQIKMKRRFILNIEENPPAEKWLFISRTEGEELVLPCQPSFQNSSSNPTVTWFKEIKENDFQKITPAPNLQRPTKQEGKKEDHAFFWATEPTEQDWSIKFPSLKLKDGGVYQCKVIMGAEIQTITIELQVDKAPPPRCFNQTQAWEACPDPDNRSWKAIVSESVTAFSLHLYKNLNEIQPLKNLMFSPVSITGLLSYLLLGSRGEMRADLEKALFLPSSFSCIHSVMKKLKVETRGSIIMDSQMFYNPEYSLSLSFVNQSQEFYDSVPEKLTNSSEKNLQRINNWVTTKTQNRITELIKEFDESTKFILLNTVYFIGKWKGLFQVKKGTFMTFSKEKHVVSTLHSSNFSLITSYIPELKAQVAKFPLVGKSSLFILLPNSATKESLVLVENSLTERNVMNMVKEMESVMPVESEVTLPKVKLVQDISLITLFDKIGLSGLFDDPNLCGMFMDEEMVQLNDARHSAFLALTEKGVEIAGASSISFSRNYNSFRAMQPFILMVWSDQIQAPLFMGKFIKPQ